VYYRFIFLEILRSEFFSSTKTIGPTKTQYRGIEYHS